MSRLTAMQPLLLFSLLLFIHISSAHGDHGRAEVETNEQYAARHMASEHHIDSFDTKAFFKLHDLNRDGFWDREEIEAVYGVHHVYSQKLSADDTAHKEKADIIVTTVLRKLDKNHDGKVSPEELEAGSLNSLPNFKELGAEGHHYDVESEFFLHHEELYHATPETQTDDSYNHAEDLEHFAMHDKIEAEEEARERKFQGILEGESQGHDHDHPPPAPADPSSPPADPPIPGVESAAPHASPADHPHDDQKAFGIPEPPPVLPQREVHPEMRPPEEKYGEAAAEGRRKDEWGQGQDGYKRPRTAADKMRRNLPYKYKFRRNWGDF
ncbi:precursor to secretory protein Ssp120 [Hysterangium stoloniferum]|nr:precursor to secretory protein Ssp120 [Hysterangium stoloniferum]